MPFLAGGLLQPRRRPNNGNSLTVSMPFLAGGLLQPLIGSKISMLWKVSMPFLAGGLLQQKIKTKRRYLGSRFYALFSGRSIATYE